MFASDRNSLKIIKKGSIGLFSGVLAGKASYVFTNDRLASEILTAFISATACVAAMYDEYCRINHRNRLERSSMVGFSNEGYLQLVTTLMLFLPTATRLLRIGNLSDTMLATSVFLLIGSQLLDQELAEVEAAPRVQR